MTLQDRILEALGANGLTPKQLYAHFASDLATAVDFAIRGLVKDARMALVNGVYQRMVAAEHVVVDGDLIVTVGPLVPMAVQSGPVIAPIAPGPATAVLASHAPMRKCRRCQKSKPLTDYALKSPSGTSRLLTCQRCWDDEAQRALKIEAAKAVPSLPGVTELVRRAEPDRRMTFSPDLVCRLIERQAMAAEELQKACERVQFWRQELADVEEVVRVATARRGG